jgi:hypothetical protein
MLQASCEDRTKIDEVLDLLQLDGPAAEKPIIRRSNSVRNLCSEAASAETAEESDAAAADDDNGEDTFQQHLAAMMSLVDTATATEAHPLPQSWRP